jgi:hypothetical protein
MCTGFNWHVMIKIQQPAFVNMAIKLYVAEKREFLDEVTGW